MIDDLWISDSLARPDDFTSDLDATWALGPVVDRRGGLSLLDQANANTLRSRLAAHPEWVHQWGMLRAQHWAVGWVDHLTFQVLEAGQVTAVATFIEHFFDGLTRYPVADDDEYLRLEGLNHAE